MNVLGVDATDIESMEYETLYEFLRKLSSDTRSSIEAALYAISQEEDHKTTKQQEKMTQYVWQPPFGSPHKRGGDLS